MPLALAMHHNAFDHIRERLLALGLDLHIYTFGEDGYLHFDGRKLDPAEVTLDYVWLSYHVATGRLRDFAFELLLRCRRVNVLQTFNAGLDDPFYQSISAKGTRICNSSAQGVAIAEYTIAQVMAVLQPIELQRELQRQKRWERTPFKEISQTRWLLVGFGPIAQEIARRLNAFGAGIDVIRRSSTPAQLADRTGTLADLGKFASEADVIVLACPLTRETRGLADREFFENVKPGSILVNIARGGLVNEIDLLESLDGDRVATAILDVLDQEPAAADSPFWSHPKVLLTAHTSNTGSGTRGRWDQLFIDNLSRFAGGASLLLEVAPESLGE